VSRTFNLVDDRWIPCVKGDGGVEPEGILHTLADAEQYVEVRDPSPLVTVALHRLLLAILHRVFGTESPEAWADLWQNGAGRFDQRKLEAYLKSPVIHPRFNLFDERHPFYQTASLPLGPVDKKTGRPKFVKPIWQMAHELAYSDNMNLFAHFTESDWETRPAAEAARWLVAFQGFALGGLITTEEGRKAQDGSADAGQLVKSAVVLAKGENLFQTLMLNMVHYSADDEAPFAFKAKADRPAWERDDEQQLKRHEFDRRYDGYLDLLTWQSRRVKLVAERGPEGNLLGVSGVVSMKGFQLPGNYWRRNYETMVGYIRARDAKGRQDPWPPLGFRSGRDLWRDSHALFQTIAEDCQRSRSIDWLNELRQAGHLSRKQLQLDVSGMSADRAKIFFWRQESLPLPLAYLDKPELVESLKQALSLADSVASEALRPSAWAAVANWMTAIPEMKPDTDRVRDVVDSFAPERIYWPQLERPFRKLLVDLAADGADLGDLIGRWYWDSLHSAARDAFDDSIGRIDGGRDLKAVNAGRGLLLSRLKKIRNDHHIPNREKERAT
jgi:CRISPR system Cascade subunit CasA